MKKILIISYKFAPENHIGSLRATKLAKYFSSDGFTVDVITRKHEKELDGGFPANELEKVNRIIEIDHSMSYKKNNAKVTGWLTKEKSGNNSQSPVVKKADFTTRGRLHRILSYSFRQLLVFYKSYDFYRQFKDYMKRNMKDFVDYDVVLSSFGPIGSLTCGHYCKKRLRNVIWICDFRDPMCTEFTPFLFRVILKGIQERALRAADYVTIVSRGYMQRICGNRFSDRTRLITNGYDREDYKSGDDASQGRFRFTYVGVLYEGKRDISPLFRVFRELVDESVIDSHDLEFVYAGNDFNYLTKQAAKYGMQSILVDRGIVNRDDCLQLQFASRYLVLATWNHRGEEGVFPGKFLEYMLINKPIISLVNGDLPDSEVSLVMAETNLGIPYEEARHDTDYATLKEYVKNEYLRFESGMQPDFQPDRKAIDNYDYRNIARKFEELFSM